MCRRWSQPAPISGGTKPYARWMNRSSGFGIVEGEYHWHKHDNEDEFFYVVSGRLLIDLEDDTN